MRLLSRLIRQAPEPRESYPVAADLERPDDRELLGCESAGDRGTDESDQIEQAYQAGYQAGYAACNKDHDGEVAETVKSFASMADDLASQRRRLVKESEEVVVRLACEIAKRIVGKIAVLNQKTVIEIVKNALTHLADKQKIVIRVNPDDLTTLRKCEDEWLASAGSIGAVEMREDNRIKRGGCLIEGESGSVEAQIDRQIEVIQKALLEAGK
jgi:flagellar assembly protein FliH